MPATHRGESGPAAAAPAPAARRRSAGRTPKAALDAARSKRRPEPAGNAGGVTARHCRGTGAPPRQAWRRGRGTPSPACAATKYQRTPKRPTAVSARRAARRRRGAARRGARRAGSSSAAPPCHPRLDRHRGRHLAHGRAKVGGVRQGRRSAHDDDRLLAVTPQDAGGRGWTPAAARRSPPAARPRRLHPDPVAGRGRARQWRRWPGAAGRRARGAVDHHHLRRAAAVALQSVLPSTARMPRTRKIQAHRALARLHLSPGRWRRQVEIVRVSVCTRGSAGHRGGRHRGQSWPRRRGRAPLARSAAQHQHRAVSKLRGWKPQSAFH